LSVPVQVIAWKGSSRNGILCVERDVKLYSLTHYHQRNETPFYNAAIALNCCVT